MKMKSISKKELKKASTRSSRMEGIDARKARKNKRVIQMLKARGRAFTL